MYYRLGQTITGYDFIFDTSDNSCELINHNELVELGVDFRSIKYTPFDANKLRVLYSIDTSKWSEVKLVTYVVKPDTESNIYVELSLQIVPVEGMVNEYLYDKKRKILPQFINNCVIVMEIKVMGMTRDSDLAYLSERYITADSPFYNLVFDCFDVTMTGVGISIPIEMYFYTLKLARSHDLYGMSRIYANWLIHKLSFVNLSANVNGNKLVKIEGWYI